MNNSDKILTNYAMTEDYWNEHVNKKINFENNYTIFTNKKKITDDHILNLNIKDIELSNIIIRYNNKYNEYSQTYKTIIDLSNNIRDAITNQNNTLITISKDVDFLKHHTYRDKSFSSETILQKQEGKTFSAYSDTNIITLDELSKYKLTLQDINNKSRIHKGYINTSDTALDNIIRTNTATKNDYNNNITSINNAIKIIDNNNKNTTYTEISERTSNSTIKSNYNLYNNNIRQLNTFIGKLKTEQESLKRNNDDLNSLQKKYKPDSRTREKDDARARITANNNNITSFTTTINIYKNSNTTIKNNITNIRNSMNNAIPNINTIISNNENYKKYNKNYRNYNKAATYLNTYQSYDPTILRNKKTEQENILKIKRVELDKITQEGILSIETINGVVQSCQTSRLDLSNNLFDIKKNNVACYDNSMCSVNSVKNMLCSINDIFCNDWFTVMKNKYLNYEYKKSCINIKNAGYIKSELLKEGFIDLNIKPNQNIDTDISYTNYYSKFIKNQLQTEDTSQNLLNVRYDIETNTYNYLNYRAQIEILTFIIIFCCISLIGSVLYHNGLITSSIYTMYISIVFAVGVLVILYKLFDIYMRDNINFNRFAYEKLFSKNNNINNKNAYTTDC